MRSDRMSYTAGGNSTVKSVEYLGRDVRVSVDSGHGPITITARESEFNSQPCQPGDAITLHWDQADVHHFDRQASH